MKTKILISAANGVIMSSLIKSLKKKFYVIGIDTQIIGQGKNVCNEFYKSPKGNSNNFIKFIKKLAKKVDFIFLFVDEEILQIQKNRKKLNSIEKKLILSNDKTLDTCLNKRKFHTFCIKNKINTPSFSYCKNMIAKPIYGRGGDNIFNISNKGDYNFFKKKKNFIVQKFIKGKEYTIDCLFDRNGELIFALPRIRMVHKGVSIVGKTVKDKRIETFIKELSRNMIFFGPINVQLIRDSVGKLWILEINPRLSGSIEFSIRAGFNPLSYFIDKQKINLNKIKYNRIFKRSFIINEE